MMHDVYRLEHQGEAGEMNSMSRLLVELVQDVRLGDTSRAWILAERWRLNSIGLHATTPARTRCVSGSAASSGP
jgi:hypothetical protein